MRRTTRSAGALGGPGRWGGALLALLAVAAVGCGRTGVGVRSEGRDAAPPPPPLRDAGMDAGMDAGSPGCEPIEERCNGLDDDCDGLVDDLAPQACDAGGTRLCVAGRWSACPRRCEQCIPGSERVCWLSYCTYWGVQTCTGDGRGFGPCREETAPDVCLSVARDRHDSPELEQCCVDNGYCCFDRHDLDDDGDRTESLGGCDGVLCAP